MVPAGAAPSQPTIPQTYNLPPQGSLPLEHAGLPPNPTAQPSLPPAARGSGGYGQFGGSGSGGFGAADPTMTISTRAAFDAINQMFKVCGSVREGRAAFCWHAGRGRHGG